MSRLILQENNTNIQSWTFPTVEATINALPVAASLSPASNVLICVDQVAEFQAKPIATNKSKLAEQFDIERKKAYEEAKQEAENHYHAEWQDKLQKLDTLLQRIIEPSHLIESGLEQALVILVQKIARQVIAHEISSHPEQILNLIHEATALLPINEHKIELLVNEEDFTIIKEALPVDKIGHIVVDPTLTRGECRLSTEVSEIDATFDNRLSILSNRIFKDAE